ncbi:MAG TPA: DoxX family membrane protein [Gemmatimonadaceae bacterium]|jgi:uncharacterized membrane protein|nr:DoxX family membrane protein [Gemmatimonadaceae bacterium]
MQTPSRLTFAVALVGLAALTAVYGDFALQWQPVPAWVSDRRLLAYLSGALLFACGFALLTARASAIGARVFFFYALLWVLLLKVPKVAAAPLVEVNWLGLGEICVVLACSWTLFASLNDEPSDSAPRFATGENGLRIARYLFAVALLPIGLSHFVYLPQTVAFVPSWLPYRTGWAYLGGAGHIAAGLGVLLGVMTELAATLEAAMIGVFTLLVWLPAAIANPASRLQWTGLVISGFIAAAAWVVAASLSRARSLRPADETRPTHSGALKDLAEA